MRIIGIDPGIAITGFGIIEVINNKLHVVSYGAITTPSGINASKRLLMIQSNLSTILTNYQPTVCGIEKLFFSKNVKTAMILGQARGAMIIAAAQADISIFEFAPRKVKMSVCGNGGASKEQVQYMVMKILNLKEIPGTTDVSDAIAVGICCLNQVGFK